MSHGRQRKEKDCLNCGTIVLGRYCQVCGQENIEPKESFWGMVIHFFNDITHFDGKFFTTLRTLVFRPGFLPAEYSRGRRAAYLHPVRMYVFTSAIFFLVFFTLKDPKTAIRITDNEPYTEGRRDTIIQRVVKKLEANPHNANLLAQLSILRDTSRAVTRLDLMPYAEDFVMIGTFGGSYTSRKQYDSVQQSRPADQRDGWLKRLWNRRASSLNEKYNRNHDLSLEDFSSALLHKLPYLLFVSLPFFALLLKLLYLRRKQYYYMDHGIFSIYQYIFAFILLLFFFLMSQIKDWTGWMVWDFLIAAGIIAGGIYLFISMKRFYKQGFFKTLFKFLLLNMAGFIMLIILLVVFTLLAVFQL